MSKRWQLRGRQDFPRVIDAKRVSTSAQGPVFSLYTNTARISSGSGAMISLCGTFRLVHPRKRQVLWSSVGMPDNDAVISSHGRTEATPGTSVSPSLFYASSLSHEGAHRSFCEAQAVSVDTAHGDVLQRRLCRPY